MREKSCGTIPYTVRDGKIYYMLIATQNRDFYGFPKGHTEACESEEETALRETYEETGLTPKITEGFRHEMLVPLKNGNDKLIAFFTADFGEQIPSNVEGFENFHYVITTFEDAKEKITQKATREMLILANKFLLKKHSSER